jgi:flagellar biosynthesis chaperone FliJ
MQRQLHQRQLNINDNFINDNLTSTTTSHQRQMQQQLHQLDKLIMHVVPIRASSPQLIEHRLSTW